MFCRRDSANRSISKTRTMTRHAAIAGLLAILSLGGYAPTALGSTLIKNICRVKGQEENTLQGLGLVVGLKGTGDGGGFLPAMRSLAQTMERMGLPLGEAGLRELKEAKNVALVSVSVTVPGAGARQGDRLHCVVSSIGSAKSLAGGRLLATALQGPDINNPRVFGFAQGAIELDDVQIPNSGRIHQGCRLEEEFFNPFVQDGRITLVLDEDHADFQVAQDVADAINSGPLGGTFTYEQALARAVNQMNVEVIIPAQYQDDPVNFVAQVLNYPLLEVQTAGCVTINERTGTVVISGDVEIGDVVVTHKNITIETGEAAGADTFRPLDVDQTGGAKLQALLQALNDINVPPADVIEIIKGLKRNRKLHAELVIE